MTTAYVIKCTCGECGPDYLHRAERPEATYVSFPLLGVFDMSKHNPLTFTKAEAEAVLEACAIADKSTRGRFVIEPWELPEGHTPGRLVGR